MVAGRWSQQARGQVGAAQAQASSMDPSSMLEGLAYVGIVWLGKEVGAKSSATFPKGKAATFSVARRMAAGKED